MKELKTRENQLRQEFLDIEEEIKQIRREIKRVKPSFWQKLRTGMKRMWLKLFSKYPKRKIITQTMDQIEKDVKDTQLKPRVTLAQDTPSKRILMPSSSFIDNLDNLSVETMSETLTPGSPFDFHGSYLGSVKKQPQQRIAVAPSSSWVRGVLSSSSGSLSAPLMTSSSSLAVPLMASSGSMAVPLMTSSGSLAVPLMTSTSSSAIAIPFFDDDLTPTNSYTSCSSEDEMFFTPLHR